MAKRKSQTRRRNKKGGFPPEVTDDLLTSQVEGAKITNEERLKRERILKGINEEIEEINKKRIYFKKKYIDNNDLYEVLSPSVGLRRGHPITASDFIKMAQKNDRSYLQQYKKIKSDDYFGRTPSGGKTTKKHRKSKKSKKSKRSKKRQRKGGKKSNKRSKRRH